MLFSFLALSQVAESRNVIHCQFFMAARANFDAVYRHTLTWCRERGLPVIDFNAPGELERFTPEEWDDVFHLKSPASMQRLAAGIAAWQRGQ